MGRLVVDLHADSWPLRWMIEGCLTACKRSPHFEAQLSAFLQSVDRAGGVELTAIVDCGRGRMLVQPSAAWIETLRAAAESAGVADLFAFLDVLMAQSRGESREGPSCD